MNIMLAWIAKMTTYSGGTEYVMSAFANAMEQRGHTVSIVYCNHQDGKPFYPVGHTVHLRNLMTGLLKERFVRNGGFLTGPQKIVREVLRLFGNAGQLQWTEQCKGNFLKEAICRTVTEEQPDVLVFFWPDTACYFKKYAHIVTPAVTMFHMEPETLFCRAVPAERKAVEECAYAQVLLPSDAEDIKKYCPNAKVAVIPNAVREPAAAVYREKDRYRILSVGRIDRKAKQTHMIIRAFAETAERFPEWELDIWGSCLDRRYAAELYDIVRRSGLSDRIHFCGTSDHILSVYTKGDLFVTASPSEGFGLTLAEAMSAGLPAVGFRDAHGIRSLIRDGEDGLLCGSSVHALTEAMSRLMADGGTRQRMGSAGRQKMKRYRPDKVWDMWEKLLVQIKTDTRL